MLTGMSLDASELLSFLCVLTFNRKQEHCPCACTGVQKWSQKWLTNWIQNNSVDQDAELSLLASWLNYENLNAVCPATGTPQGTATRDHQGINGALKLFSPEVMHALSHAGGQATCDLLANSKIPLYASDEGSDNNDMLAKSHLRHLNSQKALVPWGQQLLVHKVCMGQSFCPLARCKLWACTLVQCTPPCKEGIHHHTKAGGRWGY